jgi:predicted glycosyltransferase
MRADRFLLVSHDGFGLGHTRRNARIGEAIRKEQPAAQVTIVTGVPSRHDWLDDSGFTVIRVPDIVKNERGVYANPMMSLVDALKVRERLLCETVDTTRPDVVLVDRHPFGLCDEWKSGLRLARSQGAAIVVGLRDIIDQASVVRHEFASERWAGVDELLDDVLIYGNESLCDHQREYGLPIRPFYCGWVTQNLNDDVGPVDHGLMVVAAGGGGDGSTVTEIGCALAQNESIRSVVLVMGPAGAHRIEAVRERTSMMAKLEIRAVVNNYFQLVAQAGIVLQMAGYNSTIEALAAGCRPILVPRRAPRREQAIRASRLAAMGLADVVDMNASPEEVAWLLDRPRRLEPHAIASHGLTMTGARTAAQRLISLR